VLVIVGILVICIAIGARWLFRQREPDEMRSAVEKMRAFRNRNRRIGGDRLWASAGQKATFSTDCFRMSQEEA